MVYRYDVNKADDGVGGEEGTFCLCTLWCVEALTRAGEYDKALLQRSLAMFEVSVWRLETEPGLIVNVGIGLSAVLESCGFVYGGDLGCGRGVSGQSCMSCVVLI